MNSSHVIVDELSLSKHLKKSCNSAGDNGSLRAIANVESSFLSIVFVFIKLIKYLLDSRNFC